MGGVEFSKIFVKERGYTLYFYNLTVKSARGSIRMGTPLYEFTVLYRYTVVSCKLIGSILSHYR